MLLNVISRQAAVAAGLHLSTADRDEDNNLNSTLCAGAKQILKTDVRMFQMDALYYGLIAVDLVLRISWVYKLSAEMRHMRWFVMFMTLLEVVRRWLWAFVRIENELRKIESRSPTLGPLIPYHAALKDKKHSSEQQLSEMTSLIGVSAAQNS